MFQKIKNFLKKFPFIKKVWNSYNNLVTLNARLTYLEKRVHNFRWFAVEQAADYLVGAQVEGDYCEFGVYKGETFAHMTRYYEVFPDMRYIAFDSFEGLPAPKGIDNENGYASNFHEGEFAVSQDQFLENLKSKNVPLDRVIMVKGWYDQTLNDDTANKHNINKVSCAWIDCDFYESTVPVLKFLTKRISVGSILLFDDWKVYRNLSDKGQQLATSEWLSANPGLELKPLFEFSHHGQAFTVAKIPQ
ncbi:MAG: hypothetical protein GW903_01600 [Alphaproteobacteria bacterium]|nr:hypothetical protein [Alphaproteobacteria bacterium]NCQ87664.1 hypothetical protein [Alphaproteobacteria bacterium]NCT05827.1 hypothetical protein [Alphaproteobacteria bacterium]